MSNNEQEYVYYKPVRTTKHYLYANEIAKALGIVTITGMVHTKLVAAVLNAVCEEELYYNTFRYSRMVRVYTPKDINAMLKFFKYNSKDSIEDNDVKVITCNHKIYNYKIRKREEVS